MRDAARINPILMALSVFWHRHPDLRLAQIVGNLAPHLDPYYFEDDDLLAALEERNRVGKEW